MIPLEFRLWNEFKALTWQAPEQLAERLRAAASKFADAAVAAEREACAAAVEGVLIDDGKFAGDDRIPGLAYELALAIRHRPKTPETVEELFGAEAVEPTGFKRPELADKLRSAASGSVFKDDFAKALEYWVQKKGIVEPTVILPAAAPP